MSESPQYPKPRVLAILVGLIGLAMAVMGARLLLAGGSAYYVLGGLVLLGCAYLLFRGDRRGAYAYAAFAVASVAWSLWEVGLDPWALMPRLSVFGLVGLWLIVPRVQRGLWQARPAPPASRRFVGGAVAAVALFLAVLFAANVGTEAGAPSAPGAGRVANPPDWTDYGANKAGTRYAPHTEIDLENVANLERGWVARTGVPGTFKGTPIQVGDALYLCAGQNVMMALDPDTGVERWRFDPKIETPRWGFWDTCRGVTHYAIPDSEPGAVCAERVFTATTDARLIAVDGRTGEPCPDFGENGQISLLPGMGEVKPGFYFVTSPPTIASGALVLGGWVADNQETEEPSGVVRGFDPVTGELLWAWDMGREDRSGLPDAGEAYTRGTPNVWSLTSADEDLGLVYVPTGNATPDYFGGHRSAVMDRYSSSVVALDARTGRVRWHFQTTHHDIWDYDVPSQPTLVDVPIDGVPRKAVIVPTKRAEVFLLDRETGEPIAEVSEVPVPQTDVAEERTTPTQPFSTGMPSFARSPVREADLWGLTLFDQLSCRIRFRELRYEGPMTPPSLQGTLLYPGPAGGMNWGSAAVDEKNGLMVVNVLHLPFTVELIPRAELEEKAMLGIGGRQAGTPYAARTLPFFSPLATPCLSPPWGEMAVVDLASRKLLWRRGLGTARLATPGGGHLGLPLPMGLPYQAGSIVTAGGLVFNGGVLDGTMRAIDLLTGREVWTDPLPAPATATPMSYVSPKTGTQFVVVTVPGEAATPNAGEHGAGEAEGPTGGGYVIAYRLPE